MKLTSIRIALPAAALVALAAHTAGAKVPGAESERLGKDLTFLGAEKAGNKDGSIPEWSGKWLGTPPGIAFKGPGTPYPDPYASEKPLYTVTAQNMAQYADKLSDGQKAMLQKYPQTFRIPVYPSHRDFRLSDRVCAVTKEHATSAELVDGNMGIKAVRGSVPFPIPKTGDELLLNLTYPPRVFQEHAFYDQAVVYPNGNIAWGRDHYRILSPATDPKAPKATDGTTTYANVKTLLPERNKGERTFCANRCAGGRKHQYQSLMRDHLACHEANMHLNRFIVKGLLAAHLNVRIGHSAEIEWQLTCM